MICAYIYCVVDIQGHVFHFVSVLPPPPSHAHRNKMHAFVLMLFLCVTLLGSHPLPAFGFTPFREKASSVCSFLLDAAGGAPHPHFPSLPAPSASPTFHPNYPAPSSSLHPSGLCTLLSFPLFSFSFPSLNDGLDQSRCLHVQGLSTRSVSC